jgi:hypothetical protein
VEGWTGRESTAGPDPAPPVVIFRREHKSVSALPRAGRPSGGRRSRDGRAGGAAGAQRPPLDLVGKVFDGRLWVLCVRSRLTLDTVRAHLTLDS